LNKKKERKKNESGRRERERREKEGNCLRLEEFLFRRTLQLFAILETNDVII